MQLKLLIVLSILIINGSCANEDMPSFFILRSKTNTESDISIEVYDSIGTKTQTIKINDPKCLISNTFEDEGDLTLTPDGEHIIFACHSYLEDQVSIIFINVKTHEIITLDSTITTQGSISSASMDDFGIIWICGTLGIWKVTLTPSIESYHAIDTPAKQIRMFNRDLFATITLSRGPKFAEYFGAGFQDFPEITFVGSQPVGFDLVRFKETKSRYDILYVADKWEGLFKYRLIDGFLTKNMTLSSEKYVRVSNLVTKQSNYLLALNSEQNGVDLFVDDKFVKTLIQNSDKTSKIRGIAFSVPSEDFPTGGIIEIDVEQVKEKQDEEIALENATPPPTPEPTTTKLDTEKLLKQIHEEEKDKQAAEFAKDMQKENDEFLAAQKEREKTSKPIGKTKTVIQPKQSESNWSGNTNNNNGSGDSFLFYTLGFATFIVIVAIVVVLFSWLFPSNKRNNKYQLPTHHIHNNGNGITNSNNGKHSPSFFDDFSKRD